MTRLHPTLILLAVALTLMPRSVHGDSAAVPVALPTAFVSVGDYSGTANQRIDAAITAAMATDHKTVFFPNGEYALRKTVSLNRGADTALHLVGESRDGVRVIPDIPYLEANYQDGQGARLAHMFNLSGREVFDSVDVSIQNMTLDMQHPLLVGRPETYRVVGHGVRIGQGWREGRFAVNHLTIKNVGSYGVGIQDRGGHPKSNVTLTNLHIERTGSDAIDTKEASGDGNRSLVVRNLTVREIGFFDTGAAVGIDVRYRDVVIENVDLVSAPSRSTLPGQKSSNTGINFRPNGGVVGATVSDVYIRGFATGITIHATEKTAHRDITIRDFKVHDYRGIGIRVLGTNQSGHTIEDGYVYSDKGAALRIAEGSGVTLRNVTEGPWPAESGS